MTWGEGVATRVINRYRFRQRRSTFPRQFARYEPEVGRRGGRRDGVGGLADGRRRRRRGSVAGARGRRRGRHPGTSSPRRRDGRRAAAALPAAAVDARPHVLRHLAPRRLRVVHGSILCEPIQPNPSVD